MGAISSWNFKTATAEAPPGAASFRINNTNPSSATLLYFDNNNAAKQDVAALLDTLGAYNRPWK